MRKADGAILSCWPACCAKFLGRSFARRLSSGSSSRRCARGKSIAIALCTRPFRQVFWCLESSSVDGFSHARSLCDYPLRQRFWELRDRPATRRPVRRLMPLRIFVMRWDCPHLPSTSVYFPMSDLQPPSLFAVIVWPAWDFRRYAQPRHLGHCLTCSPKTQPKWR